MKTRLEVLFDFSDFRTLMEEANRHILQGDNENATRVVDIAAAAATKLSEDIRRMR